MAHYVIFVHGTFSSSDKFKHATNSLFHQVQQKFPKANFEWFSWSGENYFQSRKNAAQGLSNLITKLLTDCPKQEVSIISHSHGGNVTLMAANLIDQSLRARLHIVCIATPFVGVWYRNVNNDEIFVQGLSSIFTEDYPLFILKPIGDEPLFALKKILSLERLGVNLSKLIRKFVTYLWSQKYLVNKTVQGLAIIFFGLTGAGLFYANASFWLLVVTLGLVSTIVFIIMRQIKSAVFWDQSFFDNLRQTVVVAELPFLKGGQRVHKHSPNHSIIVTFCNYKLGRKAKSLRHSEIYQNPTAIADIVDWISVKLHGHR